MAVEAPFCCLFNSRKSGWEGLVCYFVMGLYLGTSTFMSAQAMR